MCTCEYNLSNGIGVLVVLYWYRIGSQVVAEVWLKEVVVVVVVVMPHSGGCGDGAGVEYS